MSLSSQQQQYYDTILYFSSERRSKGSRNATVPTINNEQDARDVLLAIINIDDHGEVLEYITRDDNASRMMLTDALSYTDDGGPFTVSYVVPFIAWIYSEDLRGSSYYHRRLKLEHLLISMSAAAWIESLCESIISSRIVSSSLSSSPLLTIARFLLNITATPTDDGHSLRTMPCLEQCAHVLSQASSTPVAIFGNSLLAITNLSNPQRFSLLDSGDRTLRPGRRGERQNDYIDYKRIHFYPMVCELDDRIPPFLLSMDQALRIGTVQSLIESQFRLLRENMISQIRNEYKLYQNKETNRVFSNVTVNDIIVDGISRTWTRMSGDRPWCRWRYESFDDIKGRRFKQQNTHTTTTISILDGPKANVAFVLCFDAPYTLKQLSKKEKEKFWETCSDLSLGSCVLLIVNGIAHSIGTIVWRDIDIMSSLNHRSCVGVHFSTTVETIEALTQIISNVDDCHTSTVLLQLTVPLFAHIPILKQLQNVSSLPFDSELILPFASSHRPLRYDSSDDCENLQHVISTLKHISFHITTTTAPLSLSNHSTVSLDESQRDALVLAFSNAFALIQGPPGCGKSFIGTLLTHLLLDKTDTTILIVAQTNRAVDAFLEDLITIYGVTSCCRVGSGCMNDRVQPFTLYQQRLAATSHATSPSVKRIYGMLKQSQESIIKQISEKRDLLLSLHISTEKQVTIKAKYPSLYADIASLVNDYREIQRQLDSVSLADDETILRSKRVIGATTTGIAEYSTTLATLNIKTIIVEEAAMVLEAHVLSLISALSTSLKHCVMIGDHQQLHASVNWELSMENPFSKFDLDRSLFERLVLNDFPIVTLRYQHRMIPAISTLARDFAYPNLMDSPNVLNSITHPPSIQGVLSSCFFINHSFPEDDSPTSSIEDTRSKSNYQEALFLIEMALYLQKRDYACVILSPYIGQLRVIRRIFHQRHATFSINSRDMKDVEGESLSGNVVRLSSIHLSSVDNFQGEEGEVVLVSLVRSNLNGNIGFVGEKQRITVLLTRTKYGLYLFGNISTFIHNTHWLRLIESLRGAGRVGNGMPLQCGHVATQASEFHCCDTIDSGDHY